MEEAIRLRSTLRVGAHCELADVLFDLSASPQHHAPSGWSHGLAQYVARPCFVLLRERASAMTHVVPGHGIANVVV